MVVRFLILYVAKADEVIKTEYVMKRWSMPHRRAKGHADVWNSHLDLYSKPMINYLTYFSDRKICGFFESVLI